MMKRAAANSAAICNIYKVEILSVQVKMLGHGSFKKKNKPNVQNLSITEWEEKSTLKHIVSFAWNGNLYCEVAYSYPAKLAAQIVKGFSFYWNPNLVSNTQP